MPTDSLHKRLLHDLVGELVYVRFFDHVENGHRPMEFIVLGRLSAVEETGQPCQSHVIVECWTHADPEENESDGNSRNVTTIVILLPTVAEIRKLNPGGRIYPAKPLAEPPTGA